MADLTDFLVSYVGKPVEWGRDDCTAVVVDWLRLNDHAIDLPRYRTKQEAHALIASAGGLVALWDQYLGLLSERVGDAEPGDVGVIDTRTFGPVGVICGAGGLCCWRHEGGVHWLKPRGTLKIWAVAP